MFNAARSLNGTNCKRFNSIKGETETIEWVHLHLRILAQLVIYCFIEEENCCGFVHIWIWYYRLRRFHKIFCRMIYKDWLPLPMRLHYRCQVVFTFRFMPFNHFNWFSWTEWMLNDSTKIVVLNVVLVIFYKPFPLCVWGIDKSAGPTIKIHENRLKRIMTKKA